MSERTSQSPVVAFQNHAITAGENRSSDAVPPARAPYTSGFGFALSIAEGREILRHRGDVFWVTDSATGELRRLLRLTSEIGKTRLSADGRSVLFTLSETSGFLYRWDLRSDRVETSAPARYSPECFAESPVTSLLAWGTTSSIIIRRFESADALARFPIPPKAGMDWWLHALAFSPDGRLLAAYTYPYEHHWYNNVGGDIGVYDIEAKRVKLETGYWPDVISEFRFSSCGRYVGGWVGKTTVAFDVQTGKRVKHSVDLGRRRIV